VRLVDLPSTVLASPSMERSIRLVFDSPGRIPLGHSCHHEKVKMALLRLVLVIFIVIIIDC
jgi:hypothetical protein